MIFKMKKKVIFLTVMLLCAVILTSCGNDMQTPQTPKDAVEGVKRSAEPAVDNVENTVDNTADKIMGKDNPDTSKFIGEDKAKEIALGKAELKAEDVSFVKVELDRDDGIWQYEVEFKKGKTEYDADIKAEDGAILKWDVDYDD